MIPRILEYEEGRIKVTAEAWILPEVNAIIKKYGDMNCEPYLGYVYMLSYPDTPYNYMPKDERAEAALFDVKQTLGDFDENCELIEPAIERLRFLWTSENTRTADEMEEELRRWRKYLAETPLGGEEMKNRLAVVASFEKTTQTAINIRKLADEEIRTKMKGANELGEY